MERGQNGRDDFFGFRDPFAGFRGFRRPGSLISSVFGGRDPFDDPFFTQPFGRPLGGPSMFGPGFFGPIGGPFGDSSNGGFLEQAPPPSSARRPIIRELDEEEGEDGKPHNEGSSNESFVREPDDGNEEMQRGQIQHRREFSRPNAGQSQARTFTFQSSSVTYGGVNGAYYTSSRAWRTGSDGTTVEESKEADTTTREATHRISRGLHDKGHSVTRRLNSDGRVDTTETLHNLNEDELAGFEESWKGNAGQYLPGNNNRGTNGKDEQSARNWALPATEQARDSRRTGPRKSRIIPIS